MQPANCRTRSIGSPSTFWIDLLADTSSGTDAPAIRRTNARQERRGAARRLARASCAAHKQSDAGSADSDRARSIHRRRGRTSRPWTKWPPWAGRGSTSCPAVNVPLQPRRLIIPLAVVGCKPVLGAARGYGLDAEHSSRWVGANGTCPATGEQLAYARWQRGGDIVTQSPETLSPHFQKTALDEQHEEGG
jgi:hypothetical protein